MSDIAVDKTKVRPLDGAIVLPPVVAYEAMTLGMAVRLRTDGKVEKTPGASSKFLGIVVSGSGRSSDVAAGETVSVVGFGPCSGFSGLTPSAMGYLDSTAGGMDTAGSVATGYAYAEDVFFVMPELTNVGS